MALTNEQMNFLIDNYARPRAQEVWLMKRRLETLLAEFPQYSEVPDTADVIPLTRPDAASLDTLTNQDVRGFVYAMGNLKAAIDAIPVSMLSKFWVNIQE